MKVYILSEERAKRIDDYIYNCKTIREPMETIRALLQPTEVPDSAIKAVDEVRKLSSDWQGHPVYDLPADRAAALIDAYSWQVPSDALIDAMRRYMSAYGPGYSSTDTGPYDALKKALEATK